jgi:cysteinyl-tRNA synthetase
MVLKLYNTLTRQKDEFIPVEPNVVKMFVCGPTVYGLSHIGHAKTYTQFDFVARYLKMKGYEVTFVQNITDVDDKIIKRANELSIDTKGLSTKYEQEYREDMNTLRNTNVDIFASAHEYIDAMVHQIQQLIDRGIAYKLDDGWYFDVSKFEGYGKLSKRINAEPEDSVARIDDNTQKRNAADFALWKMRKPEEPYWETTLGEGRPGWHIEDTAITEAIFGPQYDLHGGAVDLIFPHHENEVAQMEAASGKSPMVRYWMHTGLVRVGGAKMAKSADNFMTIRTALEIMDVDTLRYIFLSQHYRSSVELNESIIESAIGARRRFENFIRSIDSSIEEDETSRNLVAEAEVQFFERLDDDLDTPGALTVAFEYIRKQNRAGVPGKTAQSFMDKIQDLFEAFDIGADNTDIEKIEELLEKRKKFREDSRFKEADIVRTELASMGVQIKDTNYETKWWIQNHE